VIKLADDEAPGVAIERDLGARSAKHGSLVLQEDMTYDSVITSAHGKKRVVKRGRGDGDEKEKRTQRKWDLTEGAQRNE